MLDLTPRQIQILRAIIEEFISTAEPIGSDTIDKKFGIGVSPATIRNEMVQLTNQGYLAKSHSSAGRTPTPLAMKLYVNELMREKELTVADEVAAKERIWKSRHNLDDVMRQIAHVVADRSRALGLSVVDDEDVFATGYTNLFDMPEFEDSDVLRHVLELLEQTRLLEEFLEYGGSENVVRVVYGQEIGNRHLAPVGIIHTSFQSGGHRCRVAVVGSSRFDYPYVIPMMKYIRTPVGELVE